jgi:hypothetical protein
MPNSSAPRQALVKIAFSVAYTQHGELAAFLPHWGLVLFTQGVVVFNPVS